MFSPTQYRLIQILAEGFFLDARSLQGALGVSRARLNQVVGPLIKCGEVVRKGKARATCYCLKKNQAVSLALLQRENQELRAKLKQLEKQLEDRIVIERAKEILIEQFKISPPAAYRKLQEQSMQRSKPIREIAEAIFRAYPG